MPHKLIILVCLLMALPYQNTFATPSNEPVLVKDSALSKALDLPDWFKLSEPDLKQSLAAAAKDNKKGLIIYFGRKNCTYCKALLKTNWGDKDVLDYTQKNFHVIAIDALGQRAVTNFNGKTCSEKDYAMRLKTSFTPSLLFYDIKGRLALKLSGYRPPYQFRASLEYVADAHHLTESFNEYLSRAESAFGFGQDKLNDHDVFKSSQYLLERRTSGNKPLIVFFEHPKCHACDVIHGGPMNDKETIAQLNRFDVVQLDSTSNAPITTPSGEKTTAKKWSKQLDLSLSPTLLFFNRQGNEIFRANSVVRLYHMKKLLSYILSEAYLTHTSLQNWREITSKSHDQ